MKGNEKGPGRVRSSRALFSFAPGARSVRFASLVVANVILSGPEGSRFDGSAPVRIVGALRIAPAYGIRATRVGVVLEDNLTRSMTVGEG